MSAPNLELKEAEYLSLGFIANNASSTLKLVLAGEQPTVRNVRSLGRAAEFLNEIAFGADFIATGKLEGGFNLSESLEALNYAMGPTQALKEIMRDEDVAQFFSEIARAVGNVGGDSIKDMDMDMDRGSLEKAEAFFQVFFQWILSELNTQQSVIGKSVTRKAGILNL